MQRGRCPRMISHVRPGQRNVILAHMQRRAFTLAHGVCMQRGAANKAVARPSTALSLPRFAGRTQPSVHFGGEKSLQDMVYQVSPFGTSSAWTRTHNHF